MADAKILKRYNHGSFKGKRYNLGSFKGKRYNVGSFKGKRYNLGSFKGKLPERQKSSLKLTELVGGVLVKPKI